MSSDKPNFAYRPASRDEDRAEVWLHVPDDGSEPYWAGHFGGMTNSVEFKSESVRLLADACRALDELILRSGHHSIERIQASAQNWQAVATVAREVDAQHRPGANMADDDLVDVIARALKDYPGLVQERDRLRAVLDAETGRKGLPGWTWHPIHGGGQWVLHVEGAHAYQNTPTRAGNGYREPVVHVYNNGTTNAYGVTDALHGMERAEKLLRSMGRLPPWD
jgi:hypothetical protein